MVALELETVNGLISAGNAADNPTRGWPEFFALLRDFIDLSKVAVIPGNHDYYGWDLFNDSGLARIAETIGIEFAETRVIEVAGVGFVC